MAASFTPRTLAFLRALKRNNDRDWFKARKEQYEREVRDPMLAVIERLAEDLPAFAPDLVASRKDSMYRIYRDTRFSEDKTPLKTHVAATFPTRRLPKKQGAGLYFHLGVGEVWIGGGFYAPTPADLLQVRQHLAANYQRFRAIVEAPAFIKRVGPLQGERLRRVPRGFAAEHPAAELLKFKQFYAGRELEPAFATSPRFYATVLSVFKDLAPLVTFLNEALIANHRGWREPDAPDPRRVAGLR
jgi:uncharacterized protein (TIGR02453 family)